MSKLKSFSFHFFVLSESKHNVLKRADVNLDNLDNMLEMAKKDYEGATKEYNAAKKALNIADKKKDEAKNWYEKVYCHVSFLKRKDYIEGLFCRFPHIGQQIFQQLDNKTLNKCKSVSKLWRKSVNDDKTIWIRKIQEYLSMTKSSVTKSLQKLSLETLKDLVELLKVNFYHEKWDNEKPSTIDMLFACVENTYLKYENKNWDENTLFLVKLIINDLENKNPIRKSR